MATLTPGLFTYSEWAMRRDPNGKIANLVNLMSKSNPMLNDILFAECQDGNTFTYTQVVSLPTPTRRAYNMGVRRTMAGVAKQVTVTSQYADWSVIDDSLVRLNGQASESRAQEDLLHMEGFQQQIATDMFYSNRSTDPLAFTGFANIYNTVNTSVSAIANNVIDCAGTGNTNTSMWLIGWGPKQIHGIFPNGMPAGMDHVDLGKSWVADSAGNEFLGWRTWLQWDIGLAIQDWRFAVRAANIDVTLLFGVNAANLINILTKMMAKPPIVPNAAGPVQTSDSSLVTMPSRWAIYVNRTVYTALDLQAQNKTNVLLQMKEWDGHVILTYRGIPIRISDSIVNTESRVV